MWFRKATKPLPTCLFSTEKVPESHFPSKSTVSIHTPVSSQRERGLLKERPWAVTLISATHRFKNFGLLN